MAFQNPTHYAIGLAIDKVTKFKKNLGTLSPK